ncbi:MAG: glycosyl hydrolase family 18 protein [Ilumatobacteraceae bacterium]
MANVRRSGYWRAMVLAASLIVLSACNPNRFVSGWVPYWNAPDGRAGFTDPAASSMFKDVSPFFYSALPDGTIGLVGTQSQLKATVDAAHARGISVLPSITDGSGKWVMATVILANTTSRAQHIQNIVDLVTAQGFDGIDLDYEGFAFTDGSASWDSTRPVWVAFVTELAAALHAQGKLLSVTIPPTWLETNVVRGYPVYAPQEIGGVADRVRLMVYDWSVASPGPISPMSWLNLVIAYNDPIIPNSKLQLGIPAYGRNWGRKLNTGETCPDGALSTSSIELDKMQGVVDAHPGFAPPTRNVSGEMYFSYDIVVTGYSTVPIAAPPYVPPARVAPTLALAATGDSGGLQPALRLTPPSVQLSCTVRHFVYYPDATSIQQHAQAALDAGWSGVVLWALGYETADVYMALANTTP